MGKKNKRSRPGFNSPQWNTQFARRRMRVGDVFPLFRSRSEIRKRRGKFYLRGTIDATWFRSKPTDNNNEFTPIQAAARGGHKVQIFLYHKRTKKLSSWIFLFNHTLSQINFNPHFTTTNAILFFCTYYFQANF